MSDFRVRLAGLLFLTSLLVRPSPLSASCYQTTFVPDRSGLDCTPVTHQAYAITDPSGQQTAIFDLYWGGTLVSLKYNPAGGGGGTEMIWGNDPGGMVQPTGFTYPLGPPPHPGYNPEQAGGNGYSSNFQQGDPSLSSPVFGAACTNSNTLLIIGGTTDYFSAEVAYPPGPPHAGYKVGNPVIAGAINTQAFTTPYTITQTATFVPNPGGTPAYYLRITQTIINNHPLELFPYGGGIALYVPPTFLTPAVDPPQCQYDLHFGAGQFCSIFGSPPTPRITVGLYPTADRSFGTALFAHSAQWTFAAEAAGTYTPPVACGDPDHECPCGESSGFLLTNSIGAFFRYWAIAPGAAITEDFHVMVGSWTSALAFASSH